MHWIWGATTRRIAVSPALRDRSANRTLGSPSPAAVPYQAAKPQPNAVSRFAARAARDLNRRAADQCFGLSSDQLDKLPPYRASYMRLDSRLVGRRSGSLSVFPGRVSLRQRSRSATTRAYAAAPGPAIVSAWTPRSRSGQNDDARPARRHLPLRDVPAAECLTDRRPPARGRRQGGTLARAAAGDPSVLRRDQTREGAIVVVEEDLGPPRCNSTIEV